MSVLSSLSNDDKLDLISKLSASMMHVKALSFRPAEDDRSVLKDFLGSAKLKSLQSDGYNVYMYSPEGVYTHFWTLTDDSLNQEKYGDFGD